MCFQSALLWEYKNTKQKGNTFPQGRQFNHPPHANTGFLHDQGHKTPSLQKTKNRITMLSQKYQYRPPIYQIPNHPSQQLKVVLDYLDNVKRWYFDALSKQFTSHFTQQILPASLRLSPRTKSEYLKSLHTLRHSLNDTPLEVCFRLDFGFTFVSGELTASKDDHISSQRE
jgi:hypothetical protein